MPIDGKHSTELNRVIKRNAPIHLRTMSHSTLREWQNTLWHGSKFTAQEALLSFIEIRFMLDDLWTLALRLEKINETGNSVSIFFKTGRHARFACIPFVIRLGDSGYGEVLSSRWHYNYKIGTVTLTQHYSTIFSLQLKFPSHFKIKLL